MDINKFIEIYWNYYSQLENDFFALEPFCAIDKINDKTFSTKYLQLILSCCGEIDTICKKMCRVFSPAIDIDSTGIDDYKSVLMEHCPQIADEVVTIAQHTYRDIQPWQPWKYQKNPHWWDTYNKIKHHRDELWNEKEAFKHANQKTAIESLCALYVVLEYWAVQNYVIDSDKKNPTEMLNIKSARILMKNWYSFYTSFMGNYFFAADSCKEYFGQRESAEGDMG